MNKQSGNSIQNKQPRDPFHFSKLVFFGLLSAGVITGIYFILTALIAINAQTISLPQPVQIPAQILPGVPVVATDVETDTADSSIVVSLPTATIENKVHLSSPTELPTSTPSVIGVFGFQPNIDPLTGLQVDNPEILNRRPVMIKVTNWPRTSRPQAGLSNADIVFEYYIGEQMNRFLAVFYGQDSNKIGPLRSGRLVDPQLVDLYQGILVYGNADPQVDEVIKRVLGDRAIPFDGTSCPPVCGQDTHSISGVFADSAETSLYAQKKGINDSKQNLKGMIFDPALPPDGVSASKITVEYASWDKGVWQYNQGEGLYDRWIDSELPDGTIKMIPHIDRNTNKQLGFANVVIIYAKYIEYAPTLHDIEIDTNKTGGHAVFFRDGQSFQGSWKLTGINHPIQFLDQWGLPMPLKPGNTWVVILGNHSSIEQPESNQWIFHFDLP